MRKNNRTGKRLRLIPLILGGYGAFLGFGLAVIGFAEIKEGIGMVRLLMGLGIAGFGLLGIWDGVRDLVRPDKKLEQASASQFVLTDTSGNKSSNVTPELLRCAGGYWKGRGVSESGGKLWAVILAGDPMPDMRVEKMQQIISSITTTQELVDAYVSVHNKFWFIEDDLYDYEVGTGEYEKVRSVVDAWGDMMDELDKRIMETAKEEGLLTERQPNSGTVKQLEAFMDKYGYRDGCGWWVKK